MALVAPEACQHAKSMLGAPTELICGCLGPFLWGVGAVSGFWVHKCHSAAVPIVGFSLYVG